MKLFMKCALAALAVLLTAGVALADVYVQGYYKNNGTYVQPHYRSSPNSTTLDNWSTKGNVNPYTGKAGTRDPYSGYKSRSRGSTGTNSSQSCGIFSRCGD